MIESILEPEGVERQPVLSFEEFFEPAGNILSKPRCNNFYVYFVDLEENAYKRQNSFVDRFKSENGALEKLLSTIFTAQREMGLNSEPLKMKLYEAYKIMRGFGATDEELFN